ncbi:MAG: ABC transporter permease [Actinomycetota bacterium]|nr:ABC transporter permease [Actinomycetota bacterium]
MSERPSPSNAPALGDAPEARARLVPRWWARYSSTSPITLTVLALVLGVVIGAFIIMLTSAPVLNSWRHSFHHFGSFAGTLKLTFDTVAAAYRAMVTGSILDPTLFFHSLSTGNGWDQTLTPISETLTYATPLVIASIGVGIAFQTGIFNIGANGQAILGAIAGTAVASMIHLPMFLHLPFTLVAGIIGGAVCGMVPGVLKAYTGAHEVIVTLMFNYVVNAILIYALTSTALQLPGQSNDISRNFDSTATLNPLFGTKSGLRVSYGIFVAAAVVVFAVWFLKRSSLGFDFRITGANPNAARASGINPKTIVLAVFLVSGGLSGLAGIVQAASTTHYIDGGFLVGSAGIGFTAITIALLGRLQPIGIVWGSLLFAALGVGGRAMQAATGIPLDLATIIQSVVVLFVASPVLITEIFRLRSGAESFQLANKGWGS